MEGTSFEAARKRFRAASDDAKIKALDGMRQALVTLKSNSIQKVLVEWDGHGDEGFITKVVTIAKDGTRNEVELDGGFSKHEQTFAGPGSHVPSSTEAANWVADFVFQVLEDEAGGWETNEGGFGTCTIDVDTGDYELDHIYGEGVKH